MAHFMAVVVLVVMMTLAPAAQAQCVPFKAVTHATLSFITGGPWLGTSTVAMGGVTLTANTVIETLSAPPPKSANAGAAGGSEYATYNFGGSNEFYVLSHFEVQHQTNPDLQFWVNESGKIAGGKGIFAGATGNVTSHGPYYVDLPNAQLVADIRADGVVCVK